MNIQCQNNTGPIIRDQQHLVHIQTVCPNKGSNGNQSDKWTEKRIWIADSLRQSNQLCCYLISSFTQYKFKLLQYFISQPSLIY